jgi:[glutamine synthetase] adenylyltransferase / [glutamine synthetase]-adenylyl-L-tyrosine phosphorylase
MIDFGYFRRTVAYWTNAPESLGFGPWLSHLQAWSQQNKCPDAAQLNELFQSASAAPASEEQFKRLLRRTRHLVMLSLAQRQAQGKHELTEGLALISALAELTVQEALQFSCASLADRFGSALDAQGKSQGLLVVGMGKLGGKELNPSSDIDLIFLYRETGLTTKGQSVEEYFARATRDCCQLLNDSTEDGFVFRVDTRLRPHGDSGPPAMSLTGLEHYLLQEAREWERFAWLKARVVAFSDASGAQDTKALDELIHPFVFRRYLDYNAFAALRDVHAKIRQQAGGKANRRELSDNSGWDIKLGRGGIREIEFSIQLLQLLRGGRLPELREKNTLATLAAMRLLGQLGQEILPAQACTQLSTAYEWFRRLENAVQWREDEQTHWLADNAAQRQQLAVLCGWPPEQQAENWATTQALSVEVAAIFDSLVGTQAAPNNATAAAHPPPAIGDEHQALIDSLRSHRRFQNAKPTTTETLERLLTRSLQLPEMQAPAAFARLTAFFESILGRPSYFALFDQFPAALERLARLLGKAQWAANYIRQHPVVLDELIDGQFKQKVDYLPWGQRLSQQVQALEYPEEDLERQFDMMREAHHAQVFRLLAQDLEEHITLEVLADELSALADTVLAVSLDCLWPKVLRQFKQAVTAIEGFAVIAYGKLGGKELGYASDLDLVFVYDERHAAKEEMFARLVQRLGQWLTTQTGAGHLFDTDYRLRPNGQAGVSVLSMQAFETYQKQKAWLWEHQALTRARFCAGDAALGVRFEAIREQILGQARPLPALQQEVREMRQKMHDGHPNRSELFDLKHDTGGMVDIEFIVQTLVLGHSNAHPSLLANKGNIALLGLAAQHQLIDATLALRCQNAYRTFRQWQHLARLNDAPYARVPKEQAAQEAQAVVALWNAVLGASH